MVTWSRLGTLLGLASLIGVLGCSAAAQTTPAPSIVPSDPPAIQATATPDPTPVPAKPAAARLAGQWLVTALPRPGSGATGAAASGLLCYAVQPACPSGPCDGTLAVPAAANGPVLETFALRYRSGIYAGATRPTSETCMAASGQPVPDGATRLVSVRIWLVQGTERGSAFVWLQLVGTLTATETPTKQGLEAGCASTTFVSDLSGTP
jgi:hypothetical protein